LEGSKPVIGLSSFLKSLQESYTAAAVAPFAQPGFDTKSSILVSYLRETHVTFFVEAFVAQPSLDFDYRAACPKGSLGRFCAQWSRCCPDKSTLFLLIESGNDVFIGQFPLFDTFVDATRLVCLQNGSLTQVCGNYHCGDSLCFRSVEVWLSCLGLHASPTCPALSMLLVLREYSTAPQVSLTRATVRLLSFWSSCVRSSSLESLISGSNVVVEFSLHPVTFILLLKK
jgi:hypothetical protein